ncbi:MAG: ATP/ADP translocase [Alteromonadaceae bacterium]|jgi:ATP/ADP translocase
MPQKGLLQRISKVCGIISFIIAAISIIVLTLYTADASEVFRASVGATTFFFFMVGIVLVVIGDTDLPDLKVK